MSGRLSLDASEPGPWDPLTRLRGVGPRTAARLAAVGVERLVDVLLLLPRRYEDPALRVLIAECAELEGCRVLLHGRVEGLSSHPSRRRGLRLVTGTLVDRSGWLPVVWFNRPWMLRGAAEDEGCTAYGVLRRDPRGRLQLVNPELRRLAVDDADQGIRPVYPRLGGLAPSRLRTLVVQSAEALRDLEDPLPREVADRLGVADLATALDRLHRPLELPVDPWRRRLAVDELLRLRAAAVLEGRRRRRARAPRCTAASAAVQLAARGFGFELTGAQRRALTEIALDLEQEKPMARLLQGDVGCGKTAVAAGAMLGALKSGLQSALMAPTELLAEQHRRSLQGLLAGTGFAPELMTSSLDAGERRRIGAGLASGEVRLVVGTHALIQERVQFRHLGLVVIDEQHRFGVLQRQALVEKGDSPHLLVMTATPIPRSLALTLYGGLELSVIDELPPGRRPVRTAVRDATARERILAHVRSEVAAGGRAFIVFPVIDSTDDLEAPALVEHEPALREALAGVSLAVLHGRLPAAERNRVERGFRDGAFQVLLATTVVEVGVDVPEASVMVVEGAERFGLAQLHQLRGRVGRGPRPSWCVLISGDEPSPTARERLERFAAISDGFALAELDLEMRGAGELAGTRQWGQTGLRFADILRDRELLQPICEAVDRLDRRGQLVAVLAALDRVYGPAGTPFSG